MPQTAEQRSEQGRLASESRKTHANQFTKGTRERQDGHTRDAIRAEFAAKLLLAHVKGNSKIKLDGTQVAAARALLDKGKPSLQAIEQTNIEPAASLNDDQIRASIKAMLVSHRSLVAELLAEIAREQSDGLSDATQQSELSTGTAQSAPASA